MNVYVLIPVFNRVKYTKTIINCLRSQTLKNLKVYIVDDGSTDGTGAWLKKQSDINTINGTGSLLWTGAINLGLKTILKKANLQDWLLLINNDVEINNNYVEVMHKIAKNNYPAALGSILKNNKGQIVSIGPKINVQNLKIKDLYEFKDIFQKSKLLKDVDALSGRGVIYPIKSIMEINRINRFIFPHYFADYVLSMRIKKKGYDLILSNDAYVYTEEDFALKNLERNKEPFFSKLFSKKSSYLIYSKFLFWWEASNNLEKIFLPLRIIVIIILRVLRRFL